MNEGEFVELLQVLHMHLRENGFEDLSAQLLTDVQGEDRFPSGTVLIHLRALRDEWSLRSRTSIETIVRHLNETVRKDAGVTVGSPLLVIEGQPGAEVYEAETIDMLDAPDLGVVVRALDALIGELAESRDDPR